MMKTVKDKGFLEYGRVLDLDCQTATDCLLEKTPLPKDVVYVASEEKLEKLGVFKQLQDEFYGGMPIQFGYCNGHNHQLNAVEYHRCSEINIAADDMILLLGRQQDIDWEHTAYDTAKMEAFLVPAGTAVELYATTLHYAPCSAGKEQGFHCGVVLPRGTNEELQVEAEKKGEGRLLFAVNKWLIAHPESGLDREGAVAGLTGENLTI